MMQVTPLLCMATIRLDFCTEKGSLETLGSYVEMNPDAAIEIAQRLLEAAYGMKQELKK